MAPRPRPLRVERLEARLPFDAALAAVAGAGVDLPESLDVQQRVVGAFSVSGTASSPGDHSGVASLEIDTSLGRFFCTGSLISPTHLLTAAHCLTRSTGGTIANRVTATFTHDTGTETAVGTRVFVHPQYRGRVAKGDDIAIVELNQPVSSAVDIYEIYRDSDEVGQVFTQVGYGLTGTGATGAALVGGVKREGQNRYDAEASALNSLFRLINPITPQKQLAFDFDNGLARNDALGALIGVHDLGEGAAESNSAPGDSGGPNFIDGKIAAVTAWGISWGSTDVSPGTNSSFGEVSVNTRVSFYQDWIDTVVDGGSQATTRYRASRISDPIDGQFLAYVVAPSAANYDPIEAASLRVGQVERLSTDQAILDVTGNHDRLPLTDPVDHDQLDSAWLLLTSTALLDAERVDETLGQETSDWKTPVFESFWDVDRAE